MFRKKMLIHKATKAKRVSLSNQGQTLDSILATYHPI